MTVSNAFLYEIVFALTLLLLNRKRRRQLRTYAPFCRLNGTHSMYKLRNKIFLGAFKLVEKISVERGLKK